MTGWTIRPAKQDDADGIWAVLEPIICAGETYALDRDMPRADALLYWAGPGRECWIAEDTYGGIVGSYYLRPNQMGGGAHVCNAGYAVHPASRGKGLARTMCTHSIARAAAAGYRAMQFNFVISANAAAVHLWADMGFATVGRLPGAFAHPTKGYVDALVMYRALVN